MNKKDSNFDGFLEILAARELKDSYKRKYEEKPNGEKFKIKKVDEPKSAKLLNVSFALGKDRGDYNRLSSQLKRGFALDDKKADAKFIRDFESGALFSKIDNTLKNFSEEEILAKTEVIVRFTNQSVTYDFIEFMKDTKRIKSNLENSKSNLEKINSNIETSKMKKSQIKEESYKNFYESALKFSEKYEILEPMKIDKKTKMSYTVIGNKENGTVEIIFGGSNSNFNPTSKEFGKTVKDWGGNGEAYFWGISSNQVAALETAREIQKRYLHGVEFKCTDGKTRTFKKLVGVNGHSKGGGEANYVASVLNLKSFTVDPAPCEKYGMYLNNNKFLSIVPNNGRGTLTEAVKVPTTNAYMMRQTAMSQGKILKTTTNIVAIPAQNMIRSVHTTFDEDHYASGKSAVENFKIAKESIKEKVSKTEKTPNFSGKYVMNLAERVAAAKISNKKENEKNTKTEQKNDYQR
jgi:hypothetical protein